MNLMDYIIAGSAIAFVVYMVVKGITRLRRGEAPSCSCGCSGCASTSCPEVGKAATKAKSAALRKRAKINVSASRWLIGNGALDSMFPFMAGLELPDVTDVQYPHVTDCRRSR